MKQTFALKKKVIEGGAGPHLLITAGVHGDEYEPMAAVRELLQRLDPSALRGKVTLVPVVNEAAFALAARCAEDGLDLARTCPGGPHGSVTQRAAAALSELIRTADAYIDLHTGGTIYDILPLCGYGLATASANVLENQRLMARAFNLPIVWGTDGRADGRSLSVARDAGVPAVYTEYGGGVDFNAAIVEAYVEGCLNVAAALGILDREPSAPRVKYVVEDDRDDSGFLQIKHPAPIDGFFEAAAEIGDVVSPGRPLGHIVDPLGERRAAVPADGEGVVLFLKRVVSVRKGEGVGGVLPIREPGEVRYERE